MRLSILATALVLLAAVSLRAQTPYNNRRNQGIGGSFGLASGAGISYQEILPSAWGFRGALALWKQSDLFFLDIGVSGLRVLDDNGRRRFYLIAATSYWRKAEDEQLEIFDENDNLIGEITVTKVDDSWALGFGVGAEVPLGSSVGLAADAVFTYWSDTGSLLPLPQIAVYYLF